MKNESYNPSIKLLLSSMLTTEDVRIHIEYIRQIEMILYNIHYNFSEQLGLILPHDSKERYLNVLHASGIDIQDARGVQLFLADLRNKIKSIPVMGLTLSFHPTEKDLRNFASFLFTNLGMQVVFQISHDPNLIGGCKMEFNGRIADYSLLKMLDVYMQNKAGGLVG